ncbi:MAG: SDR family oxidoreductase [Deltaproteobacteria bacterium]|nr:SDR family oxidoreductase [Deltaproteobacteria bacterium]
MTGVGADPTRAFRLDGRVAVVTGASSGIGVALAEGLAAAGARVALAARRTDRLEELAARLRAAGAEAHAFACDVACDESVERLASEVAARLGPVQVLVNNAGLGDPLPAEQEPVEAFRATLEVNLVGSFRCAQRFGREMLAAGRGSIVNVASILGVVGVGQIPQGSYAASKGGVVNLTRELAAQWARRGVRVNALAPAWFPTEMTERMFGDERALKWVRSRTPMGRPGRLEELVGPLLFLASDASSYVTGHTLLVDGGWTAV